MYNTCVKKLLLKEHPEFKDEVSSLYLSVFPENERPPLDWFYNCLNTYKENEVVCYFDEDNFIGFSYLTTYKDIIYITFLAVSPKFQNKGYGTKILSDIKTNNKGFTILLCFEEVDKKYPDYNQRLRRQEFYKRNGFIDNDLYTREGPVVYQSAYYGSHKVSFKDYQNIFDLAYGKGASKRFLQHVK